MRSESEDESISIPGDFVCFASLSKRTCILPPLSCLAHTLPPFPHPNHVESLNLTLHLIFTSSCSVIKILLASRSAVAYDSWYFDANLTSCGIAGERKSLVCASASKAGRSRWEMTLGTLVMSVGRKKESTESEGRRSEARKRCEGRAEVEEGREELEEASGSSGRGMPKGTSGITTRPAMRAIASVGRRQREHRTEYRRKREFQVSLRSQALFTRSLAKARSRCSIYPRLLCLSMQNTRNSWSVILSNKCSLPVKQHKWCSCVGGGECGVHCFPHSSLLYASRQTYSSEASML